jgi:hypothetical protein
VTSEGFAAENVCSIAGVTMLCSICRVLSQSEVPSGSLVIFDDFWVEKPGGEGDTPDNEPWA